MSTQNALTDHVSPLDGTATTTAQPRRHAGWVFWMQWVLGSAAGWAIGGAIFGSILPIPLAVATVIGIFAFIFRGGFFFTGLVVGGTYGFIVGVVSGAAQQFTLRRHETSINAWLRTTQKALTLGGCIVGAIIVVSTLSGGGIESMINPSANKFTTGITAMALSGAAIGVAMGTIQQRAFATMGRASSWILTSAFGWATGCLVSGLLSAVLIQTPLWPGVVMQLRAGFAVIVDLVFFSGITGLVGGAITGIPLVRMLQRPPIQNQESEIQNEPTSSHLG